jgi:hypothetical protein
MSMAVVLELYKHGRAIDRKKSPNQAVAAAPWQTLQFQIRDRLLQLEKLARCGVMGDWEYALEDVNRKIVKYNALIPAAAFEKPFITKETFQQEVQRWM